MNIVLLYDKLNVGGTEKLFVLIANLLHNHQHIVTAVLTQSTSQLDHLIHPSIEKVYLNRTKKFAPGPMKKLATVCKNADVVHVHTYFNYRYYYLSKMLFGAGKTKVVLHEHSNMFSITAIDKMLFKKLDAFIAVSEIQVKSLVDWKAIKPEKVFQISNIISVINKVQPRDKPAYKILMVGNIRREKNYGLALEIIRNLETKVQLDIYGNINDEKYFAELTDLIDKYGLADQIKFISGEADVSKFFNNYDFAIHTATHETGPLVLMEYLSAGLLFYTSNAGQSPKVISQHLPYTLIASYELKDWLNKIENFYSQSPEMRNKLSQELKQKADTIINVEDYYNQLLMSYNYALNN